MATITDQGIAGLSLNDYLTALQNGWLSVDPKFNIDPDAPDGQLIGIQAEMFANLDEGLVEAYNSKDPDKATGEALRDIGKIHGIPAKAATFSIAPLTVRGTAGRTFASGSIVRSNQDNSISWIVTNPIVVGANGTGSGFVRAASSGALNAAAGELTVIGTPTSGITSVTNLLAATPGQDEESDTDYRIRRSEVVAIGSSAQVDSMYAAIKNLDGVTDLKVYENPETTADALGIPGGSIAVVVNGGTDSAIAEAMYKKRGPTGPMYGGGGTNQVEVPYTSDVTGNTATMRFQRALALPIYAVINVKRKGRLPDDIADRIRKAVVADSKRTLFAGDTSVGFNQGGYDIGEVVPPGRLYTPTNKVLGQYGDSYATGITIGTSAGSQAMTPIQPAYNQLPVFDEDNISVVVTS